MLIVLFIFFLLLTILSVILSNKDIGDELNQESLICILGCIDVAIVTVIVYFCGDLASLSITDQKIKMYEQENNNIQYSISEIVENYKDYEVESQTKSLENIKTQNLDVALVTQIYPDLKSNELVVKQIEVYSDNNNKIKQLKEEKLNKQIAKWWLYFGKADV